MKSASSLLLLLVLLLPIGADAQTRSADEIGAVARRTLAGYEEANRQTYLRGDVSEETIADAGEPLRIQWSTGTYIDVPIAK